MSPLNKLTHIRAMPTLEVRDLQASLTFYARLNFHPVSEWGEPYHFATIQRGHVTIGLSQSDAPSVNGQFAVYLYVADVDAVHAEFTASGIETHGQPMDRFFGCRDFQLTDPDGHKLAFGQDLDPVDGAGPGLAAITAPSA